MSGPWKVVRKTSNGVTHFVECPTTGDIRQVTTGQMRLIELPIQDTSTQPSKDPEEEIIIDNLPLANFETNTPIYVETEIIPPVTDIRGRVLRNTDARRANASLAKQISQERTILV